MNSYNNQMRKLLLLIPLLMMSAVMADDVCRYTPGQTIFRCNDVLPNAVIAPGTTGNITIYCCLTGDDYNTTDEYNVIINVITNYTHNKRITDPNGTVYYQLVTDDYEPSRWITSIDYPTTASGFEAFPITIYFNMPSYGSGFLPSTSFRGRFEVMMDIPGGASPNIVIFPLIQIPGDWNPLNYPLMIGLPVAAVIGIVVGIMFKKKRCHKKMKKASK